MKKSLFLFMFICMSVGFNAYGFENIDPTLFDTHKHTERHWGARHDIDGIILYQQGYKEALGRRSYVYHLMLSDGKVRWVKNMPLKPVNGEYPITAKDLVYCGQNGGGIYGPVCDENNAIIDPDLTAFYAAINQQQNMVNDQQNNDQHQGNQGDANNPQDNNKGDADNNTPKSWEIRKPLIIVGVSAAAAGSAYAITTFINKQWNKQYNAKKVAAFSGIGAGIMTGVYLYWPTAVAK